MITHDSERDATNTLAFNTKRIVTEQTLTLTLERSSGHALRYISAFGPVGEMFGAATGAVSDEDSTSRIRARTCWPAGHCNILPRFMIDITRQTRACAQLSLKILLSGNHLTYYIFIFILFK